MFLYASHGKDEMKPAYQSFTKSMQVAYICPRCNACIQKTVLIHKTEFKRLANDPFAKHLFTHKEQICFDCAEKELMKLINETI